MGILDEIINQIDFWKNDNPANYQSTNKAKNFTKDTLRIADDYLAGGTLQASQLGPDALAKQILLNAALTAASAGVGAGLGKASTKVSPKIEALLQWIKPKDIGVHLSPYNDLENIVYGINTNMGAGDVAKFPLVKGMTYKLSSTDINNKKIPSKLVASSVEDYLANFGFMDDESLLNAYITKSELGSADPEVAHSIGKKYLYPNQDKAKYGANSRITPKQKVVNKLELRPNYEVGMLSSKEIKNLEELIKLERAKELARSILKGGSVVGIPAVPTGIMAKRK